MGGGGPSSGPGTNSLVKIFANIFISFIGAGVLGLPYAFREAGVLEGAVIMTLVGVISVKAMLLLVDCKYRILESRKRGESLQEMREDGLYAEANGDREDKKALLHDEGELVTRIKNPPVDNNREISYGDVGSAALGPIGQLLVDFAIVLSQIGFCCAYLIFLCKNFSDFVPSVEMGYWLFLILPPITLLTFLRSLNSLAFTSLLAQVSNLFAFGVVFWFDFEHFHTVSLHPKEVSLENLPFFFVIAIYCYEGAGLILSLESSLAKEIRFKFNKYFIIVMVIVTSLYIAFGVCGYLSFGPETNQIITLNLPKGKGFDFSVMVKACLCTALFGTYPVMMFPVMKILERHFIPEAHKAIWKGNVLRAMVVLLTGVVVLVIPNFADLMALVGASCCTSLAFIMPGLFHMYIFKGDLTRGQRYFDYFLIILGVVATVMGLWDAFGRLGGEPPVELESVPEPTAVPVVNDTSKMVQDAVQQMSQAIEESVKANVVNTPKPVVVATDVHDKATTLISKLLKGTAAPVISKVLKKGGGS